MNLWVNRVRQLSILAVALFFYSCTDETSFLGYPSPNSKFDAKYIELPVASSVLFFDSLRSSNYFFTGETNRLLVGKYTDDKFGDVSASTCSQFYVPINTPKLAAGAAYDSVTVDLTFDFYSYGGSKLASSQDLSIYELDQNLSEESRGTYFNKTPIVTKPGALATKSFTLDPAVLQTYKDNSKDTSLTVKLDHAFGERIFNSALAYRDGTDTTFAYYTLFIKQFPGIAIVPNQCDKLFGFNPSSARSRITLYYHVPTDTLKHVLNLSFSSAVSYSNITGNRDGTELAGLTQGYQDFYPSDDKRYIQSGLGVFTKLDISKFLEFSDTIPNMILNSAELVIDGVEDGGAFDPPQNLVLRVLKENNQQYAYGTKNAQSITDHSLYRSYINPDFIGSPLGVAVDNDSTFTVVGDAGSFYYLTYSKSEKQYNGRFAVGNSPRSYLTRFLQQVSNKDANKTSLRYFALYPVFPTAAKSVNRVIFSKDIKLRVFYTIPTVKN